MSNKKHGILWWFFIGWWWYPAKWIYIKIPVLITQSIINAVKSAKVKTAPPSSPPTPSCPTKKEPYVYVTLKGKKYHYDLLCPGILNAKEIKMDLSKARAAGYKACDKCCFDYLHNQD